ncbi:hypothetical protein P3T76_004337 [Phytophthora citrophthora]|uniref:Uncharacterized protein n=1 Tax=Phytophthora citrophthora TaxID=4793 RepID=A0AAD9GT94_9STRA|nr:hypothetical protein P3T76_004337 [Phytophthora citrophthora]
MSRCECSEEKGDDTSTSALDPSLTRDEIDKVKLFDWMELLPAQLTTINPASLGLLSKAGSILDKLRPGKNIIELKEFSQFLNPTILPELKAIKRVLMQPAVTSADRFRLRYYKAKYELYARENPDNMTNVDDKVFKLDYNENLNSYRVRYSSEQVPFKNVIAITYAWHETEKKSPFQVLREIGEPFELELGVEWDGKAVLKTLTELSKDNWIWMDQFSLVQDTVTTTALCRDIPNIYRNARVVAFLPYKVCSHLFTRIDAFRKQETPNVSAALAEVMLHDLVCECTDGLYGWLSRLWTWQEFMLASSLRLVWGLGESQWSKREVFNEEQRPSNGEEHLFPRFWKRHQRLEAEKEGEEGTNVLSRALSRIKNSGKEVKRIVNHFTSIPICEQPITRLLNELIKRNTKSVIIHEAETASLSMGYYFCMRLLCGAEVYMPSASQVLPINCLKVLQQIASTGRKGGRLYDCYYAAGAFFKDATFLPDKKKVKKTGNQQGKDSNVAEKSSAKQDDKEVKATRIEEPEIEEELALRAAFFRLYEREHAFLRLPMRYQHVLDDRKALYQEYTDLYTKYNNKSPELKGGDDEDLRQAFADLYHQVHNTVLVKHSGVPVPNATVPKASDCVEDFHPLSWNRTTISRDILKRLNSSSEDQKGKKRCWNLLKIRQKVASDEKKDSEAGFLNAFVLSGMNEEAFYETHRCYIERDVLCGTAYDIKSLKPIQVGGMVDVCFASIYKIITNMHPSQLTRARNFNTIPTEMNLSLYPIAHAIIHASCYSNQEYPAHLAHIVSALHAKRITAEDYVNAVALLVGEGFDFILDEDKNRENQFELVKISFSDGTRCVGIVSKILKTPMANTLVKSVSTSDPEVRKTGRKRAAVTNFFATGKKLIREKAMASEVVAATRQFVKESVVKPTKQYATEKLLTAVAPSLVRASIKVVKTHHRLLLCAGRGNNVLDWRVVGYIPGFDAEVNKAVLGPVSHSGVHIKLNTVGGDSSDVSPAACSA